MSGALIYLDHAAATPLDEKVLAAMQPYFSDAFFNPSSPYAAAIEVRKKYESAKAMLAATFGAKADEIVITAGATESINLALHSSSGHIVTSSIEHHAVLAAAAEHDYTLVQPTEKGSITPDAVRAALRPDTTLVSIQLANNELGTIQPLRDIAEMIRDERAKRAEVGNNTPLLLHSDASQGFGHIDVHVARLGVDLLTLNAGKMYGPKAVGLLWAKPGVLLKAQIVGGGQERGLRSGTENVAGVIGFAKAASLADSHRRTEAERLSGLRDTLQAALVEAFPEAIVSGSTKKRLPNFLHISFPGVDGERLVFILETKGICVATGSACAANKGTRSHVLTAIGLAPEVADGSLRITLGRLTTPDQIDRAIQEITSAVSAERSRMNLS